MNRFASVTRPLMWFMAFMLAALTAGCGGGSGGGAPILGLPGVVAFAVTPVVATIPVTGTQQFTAIETYSDGSSRNVTATSTWTSGTVAVAANPIAGLATGLTAGTTLITATSGGRTATATLTVNAATHVSLVVTPTTATIPVSGTQQYAVIETFSDGTTFDRTTPAAAAGTTVWSTSGTCPARATVGAATGLATGVNPTTVVTPPTVGCPLTPVIINATFTPVGGVALVATPATLIVNAATSTKFEVIPVAASISVGGTQQFAAIETFSDGTTFDRTAPLAAVGTTVWSTSGASALNAAFLDPICPAIGCATGKIFTPALLPVIINASFTPVGGVAHAATPASLTVIATPPPTSTKFEVIPVAASVAVGGAQQYAAIETFSDGTTKDRTAPLAAVGTTVWSTSGASALNAAFLDPICLTIGCATGKIVTPALLPVIINASFTPVGGVAHAATPASLTVTGAPAPIPGPAGAPPASLILGGTLEPFGLLAFDAITNSAGPSHIYGDVAITNPVGVIASVSGPATGFNDGGVVGLKTSTIVTNSTGVTPGVVITATDNGPVASRAALPTVLAALNAVYTDLLTRPVTGLPADIVGLPAVQATPVAVLPSGGTFAPGQDLTGWILGPGVYTSTGTYGLGSTKGALTLDAGGNPDAVFVIRSTGAGGFTSTTGSVVLQGKAQAKNIFWFADAPFIGGTTFFQGTMVSGHAIVVLGFANVQGRMLAGAAPAAVAGALTLTSTNIVTVPK